MKIHFYISGSFPYCMAAGKRRLCYAKGLIASGHHIDVVVCNKYFEKDKEDNDDGFPRQGVFQGIPYCYVSGKYKHKNKIMRRLDYYFLDYIRCFFHALKTVHKGEVIYIYFYPIFPQILLLIAAKCKRAKIVKETCEHPSALGKINSKWHKLCKWFEYNFIMPQYNGFIAISKNLDKFVCKYKSKRARSIIVPILVDDTEKDIDFTKINSPYDVPYIIHTGTMYEQKDSISKIIKAFARYKKETSSACILVFTGPQANDRCSYIPLMEKLEIRDSIELLGMVSAKKIAILQHFASMTIIYKSDNLQTRNCFPTKLGEMLMCGIPVITTTIGDSNLYLENNKSAFIVEPNDEDSLINYIDFILSNDEAAKKIGQEGKIIADKYFNPIHQGKRLSSFFQSLFHNEGIRQEGIKGRISKYLLTPEQYARKIGVNMGQNNFVPDKNTWSSEPYLITIGNNCQITMGVRIFTHGGGQAVRRLIPDFETFGKVDIKDYVYIGNNALVMPGVTIGEHCIIAAGSVVTASVPPNTVVGGNPAKIICSTEDYLKRNIAYNAQTKGLDRDVKMHVLQSLPEEKYIKKKQMTK